MGSLRNPVGPLPSSIYWRRRAVLLSLLGVLALLVTWVVVSGGGDGGGHDNGANGKNPTPSTITPGPSSSGPAISQAPGGRDESGDEDSGGSSSGTGTGDDGANGDPGDSGGPDSGGSDGEGADGDGEAGGGGGSGGGTAGVGASDALPAGSGLPTCTATAVKFSLSSVRNSYEPDGTPTFRLTARNISGSDCKVDLGPKSTVLTITQATADDTYWASDDCPKGAGRLVFRVPADDSITYTVKWDRKPSAPQCATPPAGAAEAGTYLVEAKTPGFTKVQTSFVLKSA